MYLVKGGLVDLIPMNVIVQGVLVDLNAMNVLVQGGLVDSIPMKLFKGGWFTDGWFEVGSNVNRLEFGLMWGRVEPGNVG